MSKQPEVHVTPSESGGWEVRSDPSRVLSRHVRKRDAIVSARDALRNSGGGEAVIHRVSGQIEERDTIPPK